MYCNCRNYSSRAINYNCKDWILENMPYLKHFSLVHDPALSHLKDVEVIGFLKHG